jgi:hypothetical protein
MSVEVESGGASLVAMYVIVPPRWATSVSAFFGVSDDEPVTMTHGRAIKKTNPTLESMRLNLLGILFLSSFQRHAALLS